MEAIISTLLVELGLPAALGFIIGYTTKKVLKAALILFGSFLIILYYLQQKGLITVNTDKMMESFRNLMEEGLKHVDYLSHFLTSSVLPTGSFIAGLALGLKKG